MIQVAILGLGRRGSTYGDILKNDKNVQITALCDCNVEALNHYRIKYNVKEDNCFCSDKDFFDNGKLADALIIATQDRQHFYHTNEGLNLGYHILLEKPISPIAEECYIIEKLAKEKSLKVMVCHVLRYSAFYRKIKEIADSGVLGKILEVRHNEHIAYWHFAHSFVRGSWSIEDESAPMLLAKCCHDFDLIYWILNSKAQSLSSYGDLSHFKKENKPDGAADFCDICKINENCIYDAATLYAGKRLVKKDKLIKFNAVAKKWQNLFTFSKKREELIVAIKNSKYNRCVYNCENDACDNQSVLMLMENGVKVLFSARAFGNDNFRSIDICGTEGELKGDDKTNKITIRRYGSEKYDLKISCGDGHGGGDKGIIKDFIQLIEGENYEDEDLSLINNSIESHIMVFAAEKSRKENGEKINLSQFKNFIIGK